MVSSTFKLFNSRTFVLFKQIHAIKISDIAVSVMRSALKLLMMMIYSPLKLQYVMKYLYSSELRD